MLSELSLHGSAGFLTAILLAATVSAAARGLSGDEEKALKAFQKFYLDLVGAFAGLSVLSAGGPSSWTTPPLLANITALNGVSSLLPVAVGLLLIMLLVARQRWGPRTRRADLLVTLIVAATIVIAVLGLTSRSSIAQGFDRSAQRVFSSYCSGHSSDITEILDLTKSLLTPEKTAPSRSGEDNANESQTDEMLILQAPVQQALVFDDASLQSQALLGPRISRRTRRQVQGEFCDAVVMYLALRGAQE